MKILVAEADKKLARFLAQGLTEAGYAVDRVDSGTEALRRVERGEFDLVTLDWILPESDGITVCRELRRSGCYVPILLLSARAKTCDRVFGLDAGADDYMVKPFDLRELVARVSALLRRASWLGWQRCGDLAIEPVGRRVLAKGQRLDLTAREYAILKHLAHRAGDVVSQAELISRVWEASVGPDSNAVEVHVSRLRQKLGPLGWMVETVRGEGYRLRSRIGPV